MSWQLDRVQSELKDADFTIVDEGQTSSLWASSGRVSGSALGPFSFVANIGRRRSLRFVGEA